MSDSKSRTNLMIDARHYFTAVWKSEQLANNIPCFENVLEKATDLAMLSAAYELNEALAEELAARALTEQTMNVEWIQQKLTSLGKQNDKIIYLIKKVLRA